MHVHTDARVDADGADVCAVAVVAADKVNVMLTSAHESAEVAVQILFLAEHTAEVVARAGGEGTHGDVFKPDRAADALVEGAVAPAGVNTETVVHGSVLTNFAGSIHCAFGDVNFIVCVEISEHILDLGAHFFGAVLAARRRINNK